MKAIAMPDESADSPESNASGRPSRPARRGNRITRVYTRAGDAGTTELVGGRTVRKNHPRIAAYGMVDELQVAVGAAREALAAALADPLPEPAAAPLRRLGEHLIYVQNLLFTAGADLATRVEDRWAGMPLIGEADVRYLESLIDALNAPLPPLKDFVLPGCHPLATACHVCRVICRRTERELETLAAAEPVGDAIRPFINRLSDLFFVAARRAAHELRTAGAAPAETLWRRDLPRPPLEF
ncbi:MAG: cob(I)yrinic acid a,c-diamide adenosyltransferase [bacterium]|nr:cob(I)yrinic acid a,c-diamide adenosyltransferase [bacterium]